MNKRRTSNLTWRFLFYGIGLVVLAIGITLNTKTGLGVSPIISVPFTISKIWKLNFAVMTFVVYALMVGIQFVLKGENRQWKDILQIPFSFVFSILLDFFGKVLNFQYEQLWQNLLLLLAAIVVTAIGAAITVNMKVIPNPADGLAQVAGDVLGKGMGMGKNIIDFTCVVITAVLSFVFAGKLVAIGLGTVLAMVGVGRVIALFNHLFKEKMDGLAGIEINNIQRSFTI